MRSDRQFLGLERSLQRTWAKRAGLIAEEFERPGIAVVEDGDPIRTDPANRKLHPDVPPHVPFRREGKRSPLPPPVTPGSLRHHPEQVAAASQGAVMPR